MIHLHFVSTKVDTMKEIGGMGHFENVIAKIRARETHLVCIT